MQIKDKLITDFTDPLFGIMFRRYFAELGINVKNFDALFCEMNDGNSNLAYIRTDEKGNPVGFIQFTAISLSNWFFESKMGFIREFWIDGAYRRQGHGSALLRLTEEYFLGQGIYQTILTTDTAEDFYIRCGYRKDPGISAKNQDPVFVKTLR